MALAARLRYDEQAQAAVGLGAVRVGASQQHQHVAARRERAPRLHAVDEIGPIVLLLGGHLEAGDIGSEVGLGDGDGDHELAGGDLREELVLLRLGAASHDGSGEDLGPGDQRAAGAQRAARELLGGDDHTEVVALAARGEPAVLLRHRKAEPAHLGEASDDVLGDVCVGAVDVLGHRPHLVFGEASKGVLHHLEVGVEVAGTLLVSQ